MSAHPLDDFYRKCWTSFEEFYAEKWPCNHVPKPEAYWSLLERWTWTQGRPDSPEEATALAWAKQRYVQRYGVPHVETKLTWTDKPSSDKPRKKPKARPAPKPPERTLPQVGRKPDLVF